MLAVLGAILPSIFKTIDKAVPDKTKAAELKASIQTQLLENEGKQLEAAASIIVAEASGHSWLQRNWRPLLMIVCVFIVANNYILAPYVMLFVQQNIALPLDQNIWDLMKIGVGGYIVGRSGEQIAKNLKN